MITTATATPGQALYATAARFAKLVYQQQLGATIDAQPDAFSCALQGRAPVGCFGLYQAKEEPLLIERYTPQVFSTLAQQKQVQRRACAELGTRAVVKVPGTTSFYVSLALVATLLIHAQAKGIRWVAFTSNKRVRAITDALGFPLTEFGAPCLDDVDEAFKANWSNFFKVKQECYGFAIDSVEGCYHTLSTLQSRGFAYKQLAAAA